MKYRATRHAWPVVALMMGLFLAASGLLQAQGPAPSAPAPATSPADKAENKDAPTYVGTETCVGCHEKVGKGLEKTPHRRILQESPDHANWKGCESCHGPGSAHVEAGGGRNTGIKVWKQPLRLTGQDARKANETCLSCHEGDTHIATWGASLHAANTVACIACHDPHRTDHPKMLRQPDTPNQASWKPSDPESAPEIFGKEPTELCLQCHKNRRTQMMMPSHHPLLEGKMSCTSCHDPHAPNGEPLRAATANEMCAKCHREKAGPFAFEHSPAAESCLTCHKVHGSVNDNLATQPEPALCLKCHRSPHVGWSIQPGFNTRLGRNLAYSRCSQCHNAHGSDQSIYFLY